MLPIMLDEPRWQVHKFGGTSLADARLITNAAELVRRNERPAVVVSAMGGVTNELIRAVDLAAAQDEAWLSVLEDVRDRNVATARELLGDNADSVAAKIRADARDIEDVLRGVRVARSYPEQTVELVSGYGELWSAQLLSAHLRELGEEATWLDAREVLLVERDRSGPAVLWEPSQQRWAAWLPTHRARIVVITGYVASSPDGIPTTLQRNGSDFSASIFANLLDAESVTIWTDVSGVMSADPRRVPEAVIVPHMSYAEAMELAYFGAKVLHPHTMAPAVAKRIPIRIRNARDPDAPGTLIDAGPVASSESGVQGLSTSDGMALLNLEGAGMVGVPGVAHRLFGALSEVGVSVVMISQASSEHSICVAIPHADRDAARAAVERTFAPELLHGQIESVDVSGPYSILAAVGDGMVETPGISARFFGALGKAGINVRAVAQGSSERNISAVVAEHDAARAVRAAHAGFYLSDQTLSLGLIGVGLIGSELLRQIASQARRLHEQFRISLRVRAIANSRTMLLDDAGIDLTTWEQTLEERGQPIDVAAFRDHVQAEHLPHAVLVDCTASERVASHYTDWLEHGIHVITPNKKAGSGDFSTYRQLRELGRKLSTHYFYEATVGAGLPVITTLRDLIQTGDRVLRIEGVLSGSLSFLFNTLSGDTRFSAIVRDAQRRGFTEPDPREDLSGQDVARKAVILAREMGLSLDLRDVPVESLVPTALASEDDVAGFLDRLAEHDAEIDARRARAEANGEVLRYIATIDADGGAEVGLRGVPRDHPFARTRGGDNIIAFRTERYSEQPLIVQGPGAGPAVTAGGVFGDLLRLAGHVGAPS